MLLMSNGPLQCSQSRDEGGLCSCSLVQEAFITECSCLRRNTECDEKCVCHTTGRCLNRAVQLGQGLRMGPDVREINSWGFDSYTRRNIHDGRHVGSGGRLDAASALIT